VPRVYVVRRADAAGTRHPEIHGRSLPASALLDLCVRFGAHGGQIDWSQIESHEPVALAALKARADRDHLRLELSVPASCLQSPEAYADMVKTATALGVTHVRIALLYGRRYESFKTRDEWTAWHAKWVAQLQTMKPVIERHPIVVGLENHKDHRRRAGRAAALAERRRSACASTSGTTSRCSRSRDRPWRRWRPSSSRRT
jgi:sugar phosphate isomerase/epimerase